MTLERLQKVLAGAGVASRRAAEKMIQEGRVTVDGRVVTELGTKVDPDVQDVRADGERVKIRRPRTWAFHKPHGVVSTSSDPEGRTTVIDFFRDVSGRVFVVGRLDRDSEGLTIVTSDGELANRVAHPRYGTTKRYRVEVEGRIEAAKLREMERGVWLAEGRALASRARVVRRTRTSTEIEVTLTQGLNRQIRRMLSALGHDARKLVRVAVGPVELGDLKPGRRRPLTPEELEALAGAPAAKRARRPKPRRRKRSGRGGKK